MNSLNNFKIVRDSVGICICEECKFYKYKSCLIGHSQADKPDSCIDFKRKYTIIGL